MKAVTSKDPRKPAIVAALKAKSGGVRITDVAEIAPNTYRGRALQSVGGGRYAALGMFTVTVAPAFCACGADLDRAHVSAFIQPNAAGPKACPVYLRQTSAV